MSRNGFQLKGKALTDGYDWWWHSFVAVHRATGEERPFFIEYFVINPGASARGDPPRLGDGKGVRPSYAMIKAGAWGTASRAPVQIDNCWPAGAFRASTSELDLHLGPNTCTETRLAGAAFAGPKLPEGSWPSAAGLSSVAPGPGVLTWDLQVRKTRRYSVGYGASPLFNALRAFRMFWHVQGMKAEYSGSLSLDGEAYDVLPDRSFGYQDKNWGSDFSNPWIWLNCNDFRSRTTGERLPGTSLDVGGGKPVAFGLPLRNQLLVAFAHRGRLEEFNFSKFWRRGSQRFTGTVTEEAARWQVEAENRTTRLEIDFSCPRSTMLKIDYENPAGLREHQALWNGGWASGTLTLSRRGRWGRWRLEDTLEGQHGGCEYGEHP